MVYFPNIGRALIECGAPIRGGTVEGMRIARILRRAWIPAVVLMVIACGGFTLSRIHGIFGAEKRPSYADVVANISHFHVDSEPQQVDGARLPWSLKIMTSLPAVVGNIVAQGDIHSIGCRIVVDGEVKAERISNEVDAYTRYLVKGT